MIRRSIALAALVVFGATPALAGSGPPIDRAATVDADSSVRRGVIVHDSAPARAAPARTVFVGDSVFHGIDYGGRDHLVNTEWHTALRTCRRLVAPSCAPGGGAAPPTAVQQIAMYGAAGITGDRTLLLIGTGYNDDAYRFHEDVDAVMNAARSAGFLRVAWLTYKAPSASSKNNDMNDILRDVERGPLYPELELWEFALAGQQHPEWFGGDRIHLSSAGTAAVADWLSLQLLVQRG